jgi:hypothetical protein
VGGGRVRHLPVGAGGRRARQRAPGVRARVPRRLCGGLARGARVLPHLPRAVPAVAGGRAVANAKAALPSSRVCGTWHRQEATASTFLYPGPVLHDVTFVVVARDQGVKWILSIISPPFRLFLTKLGSDSRMQLHQLFIILMKACQLRTPIRLGSSVT